MKSSTSRFALTVCVALTSACSEEEKPAPSSTIAAEQTTPLFGGDLETVSERVVPPPEVIDLAREAKEQFERGNYRDAEKIYQKALTIVPNNLYILSNLGVVQFREQKFKLAEEAFKKAIAISPEDDFSHCTLGIVYYRQGKLDEAINELTKALAINPKNATAHNYLGITASQKGWQNAAMKEFETAIAIDPSLSDSTYRALAVSPAIGDYLTPLEKSRLKIPPSGYRPMWTPPNPPVRQ